MIKQRDSLTLTTTLGLLLFAGVVANAHAYGNTHQWEIGFSGNCHNTAMCGPGGGPGTSGFWGWCQFGGSSGSTATGTRGISGDCQFTQYARNELGTPNNPTHLSVDITGWTIAASPLSPTGFAFHITSSTMECTGPGARLPPGPFSGCSLPPGGDTGIPPVGGHYSLNPFPGFKINIQVNQLP